MENISPTIQLVLWVIVWLIIGYLVAKVFFLLKLRKHRKWAVKKSTSVILGQVSEKVAPLLPDFPYDYKDLTFLGKGVDYIVFDGLSHKQLDQIVFLEIKTGRSNLNANERMIRDCINAGRVSYEILRINK